MKEETISLGELFSILKRSKWLIVSLAIIAALIAFLVSSFVISPTYEASTQVLVAPKQGENMPLDNSQIQSSVTLVNTYRVIIQSPAILEQVQENVVGAPDNISNLITVNSEQNSQVINIKVQHTNPVLATDIANEISDVFSKEVPELMSVDNVKVLSNASVPMLPVKPNILLNTAIATVLGLMIGVTIAFLKVVLDRRIKTEQDVENILELPVLGSIPVIDKVEMRQQRQANMKGEQVHV
ncbi:MULTISPECIES: YveK family protein [Exiguobacterium]|uniref:YveK family protein n=1 Tax=Exiguobacterium TaxID=33986 RepID=UPI001BEBCE0F|nr:MULTISPECIES: Wzz/FepE/Etk N-terminal domain-containing protein [Exiguobacterium]MCT4777077.1 Wzz/FepE/Etk N-terminal domain-containing protein [Exiguobacterium aquaticum]MCT4789972.1 Wzz/FepE/Etk N-terminal domain-containing protein [Exiguobacterium mexicanum]